MPYFYEIHWPNEGSKMSRHAIRNVLVLALLIALVAPPIASFGQFDGRGGGGYGRRRGGFGRFPGGMMPQMIVPPQQEAKPEEPKKEEKKDDKKEPAVPVGPPPVVRPPAIENPAVLTDQKMRLDDKKHEVSFNFQEAPWPFVLDEVARVSGMTLDWNTLPGDSLNLRSSGKYPVAQARDAINAQLLARGYSMLVDAKTQAINVVNLDNLTTALVPRVAPEDLENLPPHDLVKVSFHLEWLPADKAVDEFKPMMSPKGKLFPLKSTNRLEAIDAAENLKEISRLLDEEQHGKQGDHGVRIFELRYTRASDVVDQLQSFMNLKKENTAAAAPGQQMMAMPMQMQPGQPQAAPQPNQPAKPEIRLLALQRNNSVLVNAPPEQMGVIKSAIFNIDVPSERPSLSENGQMMHVYRLATLDPEAMINMLESVGDLDPQTKLEADKKNRSVIAYATARDQKAIAATVLSLDGTDRELHVIRLRRLDADMVAGTIRALLVGEEKKQDSNSGGGWRRFNFFGGGNTQQEEQPTTKFRIEADVVANRLLVFSNKIELEQVEKCLASLGEVPRKEGSADTLRVLDFGASDDEQQMLEKLRRAWPTLGKDGNKLIIDVPAKKPERTAPEEAPKDQPAPKKTVTAPSASNTEPNLPLPTNGKPPIRLADLEEVTQLAQADPKGHGDPKKEGRQNSPRGGAGHERSRRSRMVQALPDAEAAPLLDRAAQQPKQPATESVPGDPIYITRGADGKLVISSRDTRALDQLEELMGKLAPPRKDYEIFYLQYTTAISMRIMLDDFFSVEKKESAADQRMRRFSWWDDSSDKKEDTPRLSQRKPLKFIDDDATNSILVQGGTAEQLRRIGEIIKLYDRPEKPNTRASRVTRWFQVKHNKASVIADMIKDVYRDLLSANDKALESYNQTKNQGGRGGRFTTILDFGDHEDDGKLNQGRFKGYLSLAANDATNTVLVSCPAVLMPNIEQIVDQLDQAAVPTAQSFQVLKIDRGIDAAALQKKLSDMLKPTAPQGEAKPADAGRQMPDGMRRGGGRGGRGQGGQGGGGGDNGGSGGGGNN
jgi:type II secretory pathway component GspD/PulD (secretin)